MRLTKSTSRSLSDVCVSAGQVFFGIVIAGFALLELDPLKVLVILSNLLWALGLWLLAIYFAERGKL